MSSQTIIRAVPDPVDQTQGGGAPSADYAALMMDYASGALTPAERLVVAAHAQMQPAALVLIEAAEAVGGSLLEEIEPAEMSAACLTRGRSRPRRPARRNNVEARVALAQSAPDALHWGWIAPGIRRHKLPIAGAALLRVAAGRAAPSHDHGGQELTLVLRGALVDEHGVHRPGEIVFAGPGLAHAPKAAEEGECVCLISMSGSWRLADWRHRLAARFFAS
jgi:putative transcriptional regulator